MLYDNAAALVAPSYQEGQPLVVQVACAAEVVEPAAEPFLKSAVAETTFDAEVTSEALETVFRELQAGNAIARGRSRRLVAALRQETELWNGSPVGLTRMSKNISWRKNHGT
jgi:hypothetical protein